MTFEEALTAVVQVPGVSSNALQKALLDANLTPTDNYSADKVKEVDLAAVDVLETIILSSESEGGYRYQIEPALLQARISGLKKKHGVVDDSGGFVQGVDGW